jgi:hypothetical protein
MQGAVREFLRSYPQLSDASAAASQCRIATTSLIDALNATDIQAQAVWVRGHRRHPSAAAPAALAADRHMLARLREGGFVDVTRRQYEPRGTHPRFYACEGDLAHDWQEIDDGPSDGSAVDEKWRRLGLIPWSVGRLGKGVLLRDGVVHCWSINAEGVPHHPGGLVVLGIEFDAVDEFIAIDAEWQVELMSGPDGGDAATRTEVADSRLQVATTGWRF